MKGSATRAALLPLLPLLAATAAGCQLCGLEPARCLPPTDTFGACGPDDYCAADGYCRPVPRAPVSGECAQQGEEVGERALHLEVENGGAAAMGDPLGAALPVVSCGSDAIACGMDAIGAASDEAFVPVSLRAADDPGTTAVLDTVAFRSAQAPLDIADGFAVEVVFRTPSVPGSAPIVAMSDGVSGWELGTDGSGYLGFAVGDQVLALSLPTLRTWHHVLCLVNTPSLLAGGDDDDLLCVLDGALVQARFSGPSASPLFDGPLSLGAYADGVAAADAAVAELRLWPGDPFTGIDTSSARQDALVDTANRRLASFHGMTVTSSSSSWRIARLGLDFAGDNVKLQPLRRADSTRFETVPARWPRTAVGPDRAGLLVERFVQDLADPLSAPLGCYAAAPAGVRVPGPGDAVGACELTAFSVAGSVVASASFVPEQDDLTFSAFVDPSTEATLVIGDTSCAVVDGELDDSGRGTGECELVRDFADGWSRLIARADRPPERAPYAATFTGTVWSPQIEIGPDATTPFVVPIVQDEALTLRGIRIPDLISLERLGLTRGDSTSVTATVVPRGDLDLGSITLSESVDFVRNLILDVEEVAPGVPAGGGTLQDPYGAIEMRGQALDWNGTAPLKFGVDLGTPVARCGDECNAGVGTGNTASPGQWEVLKIGGSGAPFVLTDVDVHTRGTPPLDIAFELHAEVAPTGCMLGRYPDIALVGCATGACAEGTTSHVVWQGDVLDTQPGPGLGETAISGSLTAENLDLPVEALYLEVRFLPAGDGVVLALDEQSTPFVSVVVLDGVLYLERGDVRAPFLVLNPDTESDEVLIPYTVVDGTWVQASCWVGADTVCGTNLAFVEQTGATPLASTINRARVGEAAAAVAFARVWAQAADTPSIDIIRLTTERTATSFGLGMRPRRSPTVVFEGRRTETTTSHDGATFKVGPSWPRVELIDDAPAYVSDVDAGEQLWLAFAFDLVGESRGVLEVELASLPEPDGQFVVALDASDSTAHLLDGLELTLTSDVAQLTRHVDDDTTDRVPANITTVTFDDVRSPMVDLSWRGGVMTAEAGDGAVAVREVWQFPLLGFVQLAAFGSGRSDGIDEPRWTALRHLRLSSR
ncbi:MAG: hypothetical protein A2138_01365 [Deltaproteobacteria bacterium RBG_16_71_12]|nr:MAG: hypothetical protein A2138_01365 [Deltaproteobacteria bacterium RBG_16_71_12]